MKLKMFQLVEASNLQMPVALERLMDKDLPVEIALRLEENSSKIAAELRHFYQVRDKLVKKYGEATEDGGIEIKPGFSNWPQFSEAYEKLLNLEVEIELTRLSLAEIGRYAQIKGRDIAALKFMLDTEQNE